jgi:hypothetical protein
LPRLEAARVVQVQVVAHLVHPGGGVLQGSRCNTYITLHAPLNREWETPFRSLRGSLGEKTLKTDHVFIRVIYNTTAASEGTGPSGEQQQQRTARCREQTLRCMMLSPALQTQLMKLYVVLCGGDTMMTTWLAMMNCLIA